MLAKAPAHKIASQQEWLSARTKLLEREKELTRLHDQISAERRKLPWLKVEKAYVFDGPTSKETLLDLFAGRSQLIVYHFMFGPEWKEGCLSCSFLMDHVGGALPHLFDRDVAFAAVSRATIAQIEAFRKRMGWTFKWVSSSGNDFNWDYHVSLTKDDIAKGEIYYNYKVQKYPAEWPSDEAPGISVFCRDGDSVYHTYSTFGRGGEVAIGAYQYLDLVPKGRNEHGLPFPMAWVRHHDRYASQTAVDTTANGAADEAPRHESGGGCHC